MTHMHFCPTCNEAKPCEMDCDITADSGFIEGKSMIEKPFSVTTECDGCRAIKVESDDKEASSLDELRAANRILMKREKFLTDKNSGYMARISVAQHIHNPGMRPPCMPGCEICAALWCPVGDRQHFSATGCPGCAAKDRANRAAAELTADKIPQTDQKVRLSIKLSDLPDVRSRFDSMNEELAKLQAENHRLKQELEGCQQRRETERREYSSGNLRQVLGLENDKRNLIDAARALKANYDAALARPAADQTLADVARERDELHHAITQSNKALHEARVEAERRYDCHGGPGTSEPACSACVTCLLRDLEAAQRTCAETEAHRVAIETTMRQLEQQRDQLSGELQGRQEWVLKLEADRQELGKIVQNVELRCERLRGELADRVIDLDRVGQSLIDWRIRYAVLAWGPEVAERMKTPHNQNCIACSHPTHLIAVTDREDPFKSDQTHVLRLLGSRGAVAILEERLRQVTAEGWTPDHDAGHVHGEMAMAAACYAASVPIFVEMSEMVDAWPWDSQYDKRGKQTRRRALEKAGALCAAEIDRLDAEEEKATALRDKQALKAGDLDETPDWAKSQS